MANKKHLFIGSSLLVAAVLVVVAVFVRSGSAQTAVNCSYNVSQDPLSVNVTAGQSTTVPLIITGSGTDCANDNITVQVWDWNAPTQILSWATVNPGTITGGSGTAQITFSPPATLTPSSYTPLIYLYRAGNFVRSVVTNLTLTPASCTSLALSVDKTAYIIGDSVNVNYSCTPAGSIANSIIFKIMPPGVSQGTTITTLNNVGSGLYTFPASTFTTSGTYGIQACLSDANCMMASAQFSGGTTGTSCPAGQVYCPVMGSSPAGCYTTCPTATPVPTTGCAVGERCPSNSWCSNGSQCYYPTGELTCVAWPSSTSTGTAAAPMMGNMPQCPAGTSECSPTDTSCVAIGQVVPYSSTKWCRNGTSYYSTDGANMTCVKMGDPTPAGYTSCRPGDTNCIPSGNYGPSSGWCSGSTMSCYQTTSDTNSNNDRYCAPMGAMMASSNVTCPSGYSLCSPTDTNCKQKGDSWTGSSTSYWCTNSQKCTLGTGGGTCVDWDEACPTGTKYCSATDQNCVEPGERKVRTSTGGATNYYWCGGGGMDFHSATEVYCPPRKSGNQMWTAPDIKAILNQLGAGYGLCEPGDSQCIEPGKTGPFSGWCAWMPVGSSGPPYMPSTSPIATKTCPSLDEGTTQPPLPPTACPAGQISCPSSTGTGTYCYTGATCPGEPEKPPACPLMIDLPNCSNDLIPEKNEKGCLTGKCVRKPIKPPVPCPIMMIPVIDDFCPPGQVLKSKTSPDGCPFSYCETEGKPEPPKPKEELRQYFRQAAEQLRGHRFFLKDFERQIKEIKDENEDGLKAKELISQGKVLTAEINKLIKSKDPKNILTIDEKFNTLQKDIIDELNFTSFEVYRQCRYLREDLDRMRDELSPSRYGFISSDVKEKLNEYKLKRDEFEKQKNEACDAADEFAVQDIWDELNDFRMDFEEFRRDLHNDVSNSYLAEILAAISSEVASLHAQFDAKNIADDAFLELIKKVEEESAVCEDHVSSGHLDESKDCVDQLQRKADALKSFADKYNLEFESVTHSEDIFLRRYEEKLAARIDAIVGKKIKDLQVVLDERFQAVAAHLADITEKIKIKTDEVVQAAANVVNLEAKFKNQIEKYREEILAQIKEADLRKAKQTALRQTLEQAFGCAAKTNWIGENGSLVKEKLVSAASLLDEGTLTSEDAKETLSFCENKANENQRDSYEAELTAFKDVPTEIWFLEAANFASKRGFILGSKDTAGNLTHQFAPMNPTLWGEAVAMTARLCNVPVGQSDHLAAPVAGASPWMYPYVNGAFVSGATALANEDMTGPITRLETARLVTQVCKNYVTLPSAPIIAPTAYSDYREFQSNISGAIAVDALTQAGVFKGSGAGEFNPNDNLLRSEIAAVLQRLAENVISR